MQFRTLRDENDLAMTSSLTILAPADNCYRILVDGQPPAVTWHRVGGDHSGLPMAMAMVNINDGVHYIATADLDSAFTAWLMLRGDRAAAATSLGNSGKLVLLLLTWIILNPSMYMWLDQSYNVGWNYASFPNFTGAAVQVWECGSYFTQRDPWYVTTYLCVDQS